MSKPLRQTQRNRWCAMSKGFGTPKELSVPRSRRLDINFGGQHFLLDRFERRRTCHPGPGSRPGRVRGEHNNRFLMAIVAASFTLAGCGGGGDTPGAAAPSTSVNTGTASDGALAAVAHSGCD